MEKSPLRGNHSRGIALNQIVGGTNKRNTIGSGSSTGVTYQSVNKKVNVKLNVCVCDGEMKQKINQN